ncbi:hypothetical protein QBC41DRAFT_308277 [Cercophora samala]|uniref:Uncharacterized protein n=1 Tax=Cercophora samala TaxID=330535 RepID=A0AA40CX20_9PEZI|nr:hypothetical protein QBC41DRAFT_308277 [Cercophora samala]
MGVALVHHALRSILVTTQSFVSSESASQAFMKPTVSDTDRLVISVSLALHVLGTVILGLYIIAGPVWTERLDALAIARITHLLQDDGEIKKLGLRFLDRSYENRYELAFLEKIDAWVGIADDVAGANQAQVEGGIRTPAERRPVQEPMDQLSLQQQTQNGVEMANMEPTTPPGYDQTHDDNPPPYRSIRRPTTNNGNPIAAARRGRQDYTPVLAIGGAGRISYRNLYPGY